MKKLVIALLPVFFAAPSLAAVDKGAAELVGKYTLKQTLSGLCYPEIFAELDNYGPGNHGLGIYGHPGSGEIVFQFPYVNQGARSTTQTNPMTGEDYGVMNSLSVITGGKIEGFKESVGNDDNLYFRTTIKGQFMNGTLSFEVTDVNNIVQPSTVRRAACVYTKVN